MMSMLLLLLPLAAAANTDLCALYNATGGPLWANDSGWTDCPDTSGRCTWYGVGCDASGVVSL